jgi:hypothetical protein
MSVHLIVKPQPLHRGRSLEPRPGARLVAATETSRCGSPFALSHETSALTAAWAALCEHTVAHVSQLVLLPEFAMVEPVWESEHFDPARWSAIETLNATHLRRLAYLRAEYVVGTRPVTLGGRRLNQGYLWSVVDGVQPLRCKVAIKVIERHGRAPRPLPPCPTVRSLRLAAQSLVRPGAPGSGTAL